RQHLPQSGPDRIHRLPDLGNGVAQVASLDRPEPDLLDDRVEERALDTLDRLTGHKGHGRLAGRDDVHVAHSGEALSDADLDVLAHLLDQIGWQGNAHSRPEVPSTSTRSRSTTFPASRPATRTGLPTRMPWPSRKTTSMVFWAARKPGPSLARLIRASNPARAAITTKPTVTSRTEVRALIMGFPPRDDLARARSSIRALAVGAARARKPGPRDTPA